MKKLSAPAIILFAAMSAYAGATLNGIFTDHMVLQRDMPVSVYGTAAPGEKVTVAFSDQEKSATADKDGKWSVKLDAMKASTNSAVMTVTAKNKITFKDRRRQDTGNL